MLQSSLILKLFDAFSIQRWNDHIRPVSFVEMDKNAHKLAIAYCLARYEEDAGKTVNWHGLVQGGLFELLRRSVVSDIKSPIYRKIRSQFPDVFRQLSEWVYSELEPMFADDKSLSGELQAYLTDDDFLDPLSHEILAAAHIYASYWEFQIIRQASPQTQTIHRIENMMLLNLAPYIHLSGMRRLLDRAPVASFIDLLGHLRCQVRWGQTPRVPMTSVLGHSMMVACLSYLLVRQLEPPACDSRLRNAFFGGLFHDLPEAVTRDIISPVKGAVKELQEVIGSIEAELVEKEILPLLDNSWHDEFSYFTRDEFRSKIQRNGTVEFVTSDDISSAFNADEYWPIDGELIKVADHLAAFVEARQSIDAGFSTKELEVGVHSLRELYEDKIKVVAGINVGAIYKNL